MWRLRIHFLLCNDKKQVFIHISESFISLIAKKDKTDWSMKLILFYMKEIVLHQRCIIIDFFYVTTKNKSSFLNPKYP